MSCNNEKIHRNPFVVKAIFKIKFHSRPDKWILKCERKGKMQKRYKNVGRDVWKGC